MMHQCKLFVPIVIFVWLTSCSEHKNEHASHDHEAMELLHQVLISDENKEAGGTYFAKDQHGTPVLCWTEKADEEGESILKFSKFNISESQFEKPVEVPPSIGTRLHGESMNKIAFKKDGTLVAVYAVKHPTEENRFAGSIFYTVSSDDGGTWSKPEYLHTDTFPGFGRGYFDLKTLSDGEIGAIWLDGRFGDTHPGSDLYFAKTEKGAGFGKDTQIGESTCECCRTALFVDDHERIHVAYRDILFPSALKGQPVRDMVHSISYDNGNSFSEAKRISADNWAIEGCPHTGPAVAVNKKGLHAAWYTAGGDQGLYYTSSDNDGKSFNPRSKISGEAKHPQMIALSDGDLVIVWDEIQRPEKKAEKTVASAHQHEDGNHTTSPAGRQVILQLRKNNEEIINKVVSNAGADASYPSLMSLGNSSVIVAWTENTKNGMQSIHYKIVDLREI